MYPYHKVPVSVKDEIERFRFNKCAVNYEKLMPVPVRKRILLCFPFCKKLFQSRQEIPQKLIAALPVLPVAFLSEQRAHFRA